MIIPMLVLTSLYKAQNDAIFMFNIQGKCGKYLKVDFLKSVNTVGNYFSLCIYFPFTIFGCDNLCNCVCVCVCVCGSITQTS